MTHVLIMSKKQGEEQMCRRRQMAESLRIHLVGTLFGSLVICSLIFEIGFHISQVLSYFLWSREYPRTSWFFCLNSLMSGLQMWATSPGLRNSGVDFRQALYKLSYAPSPWYMVLTERYLSKKSHEATYIETTKKPEVCPFFSIWLHLAPPLLIPLHAENRRVEP